MNLSTATRHVEALVSYWPSAPMPDETAVLWAQALTEFESADILEATVVLARSRQWLPSLAEIVAIAREARNDRVRAANKALPVGTKAATEDWCSFAEYLRDHPEARARVLALGDRQTSTDRKRDGTHPIVSGIGWLLENDTWQSEVVYGRPTKAKA